MVSFWKENKPKNPVKKPVNRYTSPDGNDALQLKDFSVNFSTSNGHQSTLEQPTANKGFKLPKIRTFESTILEFKNIETAKSHLKLTLKKYSTILFALGCIAAIIAIIDSQITTLKRETIAKIKRSNITSPKDLNRLDLYTGIQVSARSVISILSITTWIYLYIYYTHLHTLSVLRNIYLRGFSFWLTPLALKFTIECIICLIHVPPGIHIFPEEAQLIVFLRFYLIGRLLRQKHKLVNSKSTRFLASVTKTELSSVFLLKTYFMRRPFLLIISSYLITVALGGYGVYLVEREHSYADTIWMLIVTMTTVGFGDFVPSSTIARAFVAVIAVIGIFLMALCISLVHESLQLTQQEKRILAYVESTEKSRLLKEIAATAIQSWWRYIQLVSKCQGKQQRTVSHWMKLTAMRTKLYSVIVKWRNVKMPQEDHWRKEFLGDNTAMLLTDVSREVLVIRDFLQNIVRPVLEPLVAKKDEPAAVTSEDEAHSVHRRPSWQHEFNPQTVIQRAPVLAHGNQFVKETILNGGEGTILDQQSHHIENEPLFIQRYDQTHHNLTQNHHPSNFHNYFTNGNSHFENNHKDVDSSIILLQNQIRLMQGNLDEMYIKSKQDLRDLESIANCLANVGLNRNFQAETSFCLNCRLLSQMRSSSC